jgi:putative restriction endonuclease
MRRRGFFGGRGGGVRVFWLSTPQPKGSVMLGRAYIGVTDEEWYRVLSSKLGLDEVNFWRPNPIKFCALQKGDPFLFKLHYPQNCIVGGGYYWDYIKLTTSAAWKLFEEKNGAVSLLSMRQRIEKYRKTSSSSEDYEIGCVLLVQPFFFEEAAWISAPKDWKPNIVSGKGYPLSEEPGKSLWRQIEDQMLHRRSVMQVAETPERYGTPILTTPRLGQGTFRLAVREAYRCRCAVSGEKVLPVLDAAHIKCYEEGGEHRVDNGLLLRKDFHALLDEGLMTVTPEHRVEMSSRIKTEYHNGKEYFKLHGNAIALPANPADHPNVEFLRWHNENRFKSAA